MYFPPKLKSTFLIPRSKYLNAVFFQMKDFKDKTELEIVLILSATCMHLWGHGGSTLQNLNLKFLTKPTRNS